MRLPNKKRRRGQRWFFATDVHGSDRCYRKFLAAASVYEADVLLLGGDVAGKGIVPIVQDGERFRFSFQGIHHDIGETEVEGAIERIAFNGLYPYVCTTDSRDRLHDNSYRDEVFDDLIREQLTRWSELTAERLPTETRCIITPGNDDPLVVDAVLATSTRIECPERELCQVGPTWLASLGNTNVTPWHTEREYAEEELAEQIRDMLDGTVAGGESIVFNFHCPPYGSGLDTAAELDFELRPVARNGGVVEIPVGSSAVRDAIKEYQPTAGLHGHIHESRGLIKIGHTMCFNPGSDYSAGILKGVILDLDTEGRYLDHIFTSG